MRYGPYHDTKQGACEGLGVSGIRAQDYHLNFQILEGLWVLTELERF